MSKKIVVPEGMLKAAIEARYNGKPTPNLIHVDQVRVIVEAALLWLSDNPIVPTDEQCEKLSTRWYPKSSTKSYLEEVLVEWQCRMFLAPEPEVPEEIKDMQGIHLESVKDQDDLNRLVIKLNIEAFRRGKESK